MQANQNKALIPSLNFLVFYRIFSVQKIGLISSFILLGISYSEINAFIFNRVAAYLNDNSDFLHIIKVIVSYGSMLTYIDLNLTFYNVLRYLVCVVNIGYLLLFLTMRRMAQTGKFINGVERLFGLYHIYYIKVFMFPIFEIIFREILCDKSLFILLNQECLTGVNIFLFVLAIISLICALIMIALTLFYAVNGIYDKKSFFSGENRLWETMIAFIKVLVPLIAIVGENTRTFCLIYTGINVFFSSILLSYFIAFCPYNKTPTEFFSIFGLVVYWIESVILIICIAYTDVGFSPHYIFMWIVPMMTFAAIYLYRVRKQRLVSKLKISSTRELLRQIQFMLQLKESDKMNAYSETFFRGLISRHKITCVNLRCFCKSDELYDPKKNRAFGPDTWATQKSLFIKYYVKYLFEDAIERGANDPGLLISYAEFLFQKFRNTHLASYQIVKLVNSNRFLYPSDRMRINKLQQKISAHISTRNTEAIDKTLEIENVIFVEEQLEKVLQSMQNIIFVSISFWNYLLNKEIDLDKLKVLAEEMDKSVEETTKSWVPLKPYLYKQKKIMYYYNWFLKDFLQKKIILSEEEVDNLFEKDDLSCHSHDFLGIIKDDHIIFQEDSAVVHMSGNYNDLGKIIKSNSNTVKMFGFKEEELQRSNVEILMPNIIAHRHGYYLNSFIATGRSKVLYAQKKTFAKDKNGHIMPIWLVVKQINTLEGQIQYAALLKPLSQKKDEQNYYLLLNNFGEISGVSKNFTDFMGFHENLFQKTEINIIMLAPKLIKYFFFAKMFNGEPEVAASSGSKIMASFSSVLKKSIGNSPARFSVLDVLEKKNPIKALAELDNIKEEDAVHDNEEDKGEEDDEEEIIEDKGDNILVEFTLRIPKSLKTFLREFTNLKSRHHELLKNQRFLFEAIRSKAVEKTVGENKSATSLSPDRSPTTGLKKAIGHITNFKHAIDSYVGALRYMAEKIVRTGQNNVYRVKGVIVTDYYGPDKDVIKYIKIIDIVKKSGKFTHLSDPSLSKKNTETSDISQSYSSANNMQLRALRKSIKINKINSEQVEESKPKDSDEIQSHRTGTKVKLIEQETAQNGIGGELQSYTSRSKSLKHQESSKSGGKSEFEEDDKDNNVSRVNSDQQAIMNELKNNILTHYENIYQKEDHLMIDKNFRGLKNINWFIRILFLSLIPLNIIVYLVGPYSTFKELQGSINDIYSNEDLRRNYIRCHDAIITLILNNNGTFDSLKSTKGDAIQRLIDYDLQVIKNSYQHIFRDSSTDEWTRILYDYAPQVEKDISVNYQGSFKGSITNIENAIQKLTNSLFEITFYNATDYLPSDKELTFFRINSLEKFNKILGDVTKQIFDSLGEEFSASENLSILILLLEGLFFFVSFFVILRLILVVIWSLREILVIFTAIDNQQIKDTVKYFQRLLEYLEVSNNQYLSNANEISEAHSRRETMKIKSLKHVDDQKQKLQKKAKKINYGKFMRKDSFKILIYYILCILLSFSLSLLFHFQSKTTIDFIQEALADGQRFIQLSPVYITSLIGLKQLTFNKTEYKSFDLPYIQDVLFQLETTLTRIGYNADLGFIETFRQVLDGNPCETFKSSIDPQDIPNCYQLSLGRLSTGLISFHNYYKNEVLDYLTLNDEGTFGSIGPNDIYEFGEVIRIIDGVLMERTLTNWRDDMNDYMSSRESFLAAIISLASLLNVGVYFVASKGVVGVLKDRFLFYRKIYNEYMLGEAPVKEKRIKAILVKYRLLHK